MNTPKIHAWLNTIQNGTDEARKALNTMDGNYYLVLDPLNAYYRRMIYQEVESGYGNLLSVVKLDMDNMVDVVGRCHVGSEEKSPTPARDFQQGFREERQDHRHQISPNQRDSESDRHSSDCRRDYRAKNPIGRIRNVPRFDVFVPLVHRSPSSNLPRIHFSSPQRLLLSHRHSCYRCPWNSRVVASPHSKFIQHASRVALSR